MAHKEDQQRQSDNEGEQSEHHQAGQIVWQQISLLQCPIHQIRKQNDGNQPSTQVKIGTQAHEHARCYKETNTPVLQSPVHEIEHSQGEERVPGVVESHPTKVNGIVVGAEKDRRQDGHPSAVVAPGKEIEQYDRGRGYQGGGKAQGHGGHAKEAQEGRLKEEEKGRMGKPSSHEGIGSASLDDLDSLHSHCSLVVGEHVGNAAQTDSTKKECADHQQGHKSNLGVGAEQSPHRPPQSSRNRAPVDESPSSQHYPCAPQSHQVPKRLVGGSRACRNRHMGHETDTHQEHHQPRRAGL